MKIVTCLEKYVFMTRRHFSVLMGAALVVLSLGASCKEDPPKEPGYCQKYPGQCETIMEAKSYFLFNVGSWWVYEEETTHERDSLYVYQAADNASTPEFTTYIRSANDGAEYTYYPLVSGASGCSNNGISSQKCIYIYRIKTEPGSYIGESICFFIQYWKGAEQVVRVYPHPSKIKIEDVHSFFNLNTLNFNRTIQVSEEKDVTEDFQSTIHFFSKDVGLVRKELLDSNEVWNLVSYYIEP